MFQAQNRETRPIKKYLKSFCVLQGHYDDERNKTVLHNATSDLQDQDQNQFFWSETGLVIRPMVSDHITGGYFTNGNDYGNRNRQRKRKRC